MFLLSFILVLLREKHFQRLCLIIKDHMAIICVQVRLNRTGYLIGTWLGNRESSAHLCVLLSKYFLVIQFLSTAHRTLHPCVLCSHRTDSQQWFVYFSCNILFFLYSTICNIMSKYMCLQLHLQRFNWLIKGRQSFCYCEASIFPPPLLLLWLYYSVIYLFSIFIFCEC